MPNTRSAWLDFVLPGARAIGAGLFALPVTERRARRRLARLPVISMTEVANYYEAWTSPNADLTATARNAAGDVVGSVVYALSPLNDKLYLFRIDVDEAFRRRGYGLAMLAYLSQIYGLPITAVKELYSAKSFWDAARRLTPVGVLVTSDLAIGEMDAEAVRWRHLKPSKDLLGELIHHRLHTLHEPWNVAIGRGFDK